MLLITILLKPLARTDLGAQRFREEENVPRLRGFRHYYVRSGGKYQVKKKGIPYWKHPKFVWYRGRQSNFGVFLFFFLLWIRVLKTKWGVHLPHTELATPPMVTQGLTTCVASLIRVINLYGRIVIVSIWLPFALQWLNSLLLVLCPGSPAEQIEENLCVL